MAYSHVTYTSDGTNRLFAVPFPYLQKSHVEVLINDVLTTAFTWSTTTAIELTTAAAAGASVKIRRVTYKDKRLVDFQDATTLTEALLDLDGDQLIYVMQESLDEEAANKQRITDLESTRVLRAGDSMSGALNMGGNRLHNPQYPAADDDVATKQYVDTKTMSGHATQIKETFTATQGQTLFNLQHSYIPGASQLDVFVNGIHQTGVTETSGQSFTFTEGTQAGDVVQAVIRGSTINTIEASNVGYTPPGTDKVARNVQDKLGTELTSVLDSGAKGDGITDDQPAIQKAIDALAALGGGELLLPRGTYLLGASLNLKAGVYLVGEGQYATTLKANGNFAVLKCIGTSAAVINRGGARKMLIRGGGKNNASAHGIQIEWVNRQDYADIRFHACRMAFVFANVWQVKMDNLHVDGGGADQNYIGFYAKEVDPSNQNNAVQAVNCMAQGVELYGFRLINFNGSKFTNCEATNGTHAWYLGDPTTGTEAIRWGHFVNCLGDTTSGDIWRLEKGAASSFQQCQFTNCWAGNTTAGNGWRIAGVSQCLFSAPMVVSSNKSAMHILSSSRLVLAAAQLLDYDGANAGNAGITLENSLYVEIGTSHLYTAVGSGKALVETGTSNANIAIGNSLHGGFTKIGASSRFMRNLDAVGEKAGSANIAAGTTSVTVNHGLPFTPSPNDIRITPRDGGAGAGWYSVQNVTATTFQIVANAAPTGTTTIGWSIDPLS